jgi:hypothetical protein
MVQIVRVDQAPPPATTGRSCIYILRTPGGEFYVGESDKLSSTHSCSHKEETVGFTIMEFFHLQDSSTILLGPFDVHA